MREESSQQPPPWGVSNVLGCGFLEKHFVMAILVALQAASVQYLAVHMLAIGLASELDFLRGNALVGNRMVGYQ